MKTATANVVARVPPAPLPVRCRTGAVLAAVATSVALAVAPVALACMCAEPPPPARALEQADAAFAGRVLEVERAELRTAVGSLPRLRVTVELERAWKGIDDGAAGGVGEGAGHGRPPGAAEGTEAPRTVVVWTGLGGGDCGFAFEAGKSYLVYAHRGDDGSLSTDLCTRTRLLDRAAEDLEALEAAVGEPGGSNPAPGR